MGHASIRAGRFFASYLGERDFCVVCSTVASVMTVLCRTSLGKTRGGGVRVRACASSERGERR